MPFFNVDDDFPNSKPVMRIPRRNRAAAIGVWTLCGAWSAKELTNGYVPDAVVDEYGGTAKIREMLFAASLWEQADGGVQYRNWPKWQRTKEQVLVFREKTAARQRRYRTGNNHDPPTGDDAECNAVTSALLTPLPHSDSRCDDTVSHAAPIPRPSLVTFGGETHVSSGPASAASPPPQFCSKHMPSGTNDDCRACMGARKRHEVWLTEQTLDSKRAEQQRSRDERVAWRAAVDNCDMCDDNGYIGNTVCHHDPKQLEVNRRGSAAVREAFNESKAKRANQ